MGARFNRLTTRGQLLAVAGLSALALYLFYALAWQPLNGRLLAASREYNRLTLDLRQVNVLAEGIAMAQAASAGTAADTESLTAIVNRSLQSSPLQPSRLQQVSNNQVQVRIEDAAFSDAIGWLHTLDTMPGLIVEDLSLNPAGERRVTISLSLGRMN